MAFLNDTEYYDKAFSCIDLSKEAIALRRLSGCEFDGCQFIDCNFSEVAFINCRFNDCRFCKCNLSVMKVTDTSFVNTVFDDSKIMGVNWTDIFLSKLGGSYPFKLLRCDISMSSFMSLDIPGLVIEECRAHDIDFRGTNLISADLTGSDFANSQFVDTNLSGAKMQNATNYYIDMNLNNVKGAQFSLPEAMSLLMASGIIIE